MEKKIIRLAIVGSRSFNDYEQLKTFINETINKNNFNISQIISGGAKGADILGAQFAIDNKIELIEYKPDWKKYGRSAGFKRNVDIIENCDFCIAFWDGKSNGTKHDIDLCKQMNKSYEICYFE